MDETIEKYEGIQVGNDCEEHARTEGGRLERKGALAPGVSASRGSPPARRTSKKSWSGES